MVISEISFIGIPEISITLSPYGLGAGVDLFFCISGYVITKAYYQPIRSSATQGTLTFGRTVGVFFLRRLFRIMPAALAWLFIVSACSVWFNQTNSFGTLAGNVGDLTAVALNVSNYHFVNWYLGGHASPSCGNNGIYWSISLEEQFYFVFPLFVFMKKWWIGLLTACVIVTMVLIDRTLLVWFTRVDGLLLGVCLGLLSDEAWFGRINFRSNRVVSAAVVTGASWAALMMPSLPWSALFPEATTLICLALVALASFDKGYTFGNGRVRGFFAYVGSRSFSLYLAHNPTYWLMRELADRTGALNELSVPKNNVLYTLSAFVVLLFLSEASYRLVEVPFRNWGRTVTGGPLRRPIKIMPCPE